MSDDMWPEMKLEDKSTKIDYWLIPIEALEREAANMQRGMEKLGRKEGDWKAEVLLNPERYKKSLLRHTYQYLRGDDDEDHLAAIRCNTAILAWWETNNE